MKKIIGILLFITLGSATAVNAQSKVEKAGHGIKKGAKKVGNKTAELASKGKSKVADKTVKDKTGPNGETIYIDDHSKYYWVDKKGHKQFVTEAALRSKN